MFTRQNLYFFRENEIIGLNIAAKLNICFDYYLRLDSTIFPVILLYAVSVVRKADIS